MNLYHISQTANNDYDSYDSAVVAAKNEVVARQIRPYFEPGSGSAVATDYADRYSWVQDTALVTVKLIGKAVDGTKQGVICASFNAS